MPNFEASTIGSVLVAKGHSLTPQHRESLRSDVHNVPDTIASASKKSLITLFPLPPINYTVCVGANVRCLKATSKLTDRSAFCLGAL